MSSNVKDKIASALHRHQQWLQDKNTGAQANLPGWDLSGIDFSQWDLSEINLRRCELTDCRFPMVMRNANLSLASGKNVDFSSNKTDLTGTTFQNADLSGFNLIGAKWGGSELVATPHVFKDYWCMVTDSGLQVGCSFYTIEQAMSLSNDDLKQLDPDFADGPVEWWSRNKQQILEMANAYAAKRRQ